MEHSNETHETPSALRALDRIIMRCPGDLSPYSANARTHSPEQIAQIARSISEFGFVNPVLIDSDGGIIAGHGRVLAAQLLGMTEVPTLDVGWLTPTQRRAYILADNQLALNAGWDEQLLQAEAGALNLEGFDLSLIGFDEGALARMLEGVPQFEPASQEEQGRLDEKTRHVCPNCGHEL